MSLMRGGGRAAGQWAVALLVLTSLASLLLYWQSTIGIDKDSAALNAFEDRLELAKQALPVQRGEVGYLSNWDVAGIQYDYADQEGEFILAQYALAPLILRRGADQEWNVAVLSDGAMQTWEQAHAGEYEIIFVKHNMYLLHKLNP